MRAWPVRQSHGHHNAISNKHNNEFRVVYDVETVNHSKHHHREPTTDNHCHAGAMPHSYDAVQPADWCAD